MSYFGAAEGMPAVGGSALDVTLGFRVILVVMPVFSPPLSLLLFFT